MHDTRYDYGYWNPNEQPDEGEPTLPPLPDENGPGGPPDALGVTAPVTWPTGPPPATTSFGAASPAASTDYGEEYFDPGTGQIWRKWMQNGQEQYAYVRDANPWERPGAPQSAPSYQNRPSATTPTGATNTMGIYNRGPIQDLLSAMTLQHQIWREKLAGRANEKQTALTAALNFGNQMGYAVAPDWFLRFVHDKEAEAGIPPDPSTVKV